MKNIFKGNKVTLALAIIVSVFFIVTTVSAVTTISTAISTAGNITTTAGNIEATAGTLTIGGASTLTGNTAVTGTLGVTGLTTLVNASTTGNVSTAGNLWVNGYATTTGSNGNIATNGSLTVGSAGSAVSSIVFGYCNISDSAAITASTSAYFLCTGATGITTAFKVFVQATSSLPTGLFVEVASTTANSTINVRIFNSIATGIATAPGAISLNFFGIR